MDRRTTFKALLAAGLAAPALIGPRAARAEIRQRTLRFAHQNNADHPQGQGVRKFAELMGERSGGKVSVRAFPGGSLGGDLQTVSALQGGTVDLTVLNSGLLIGLQKEFGLLDLPFLFTSPRQADALVDGAFGQRLHSTLPERQLIGLGYWELGFRNLTNSRRAIARVEDIQGLKVRVLQSPIYIEMWNALGANAVPMPFPEVYTALEQRTVDGQENPVSVINNAKFFEVQRHLTLTRHIYNPQSVIMSKRVWDRLNAEEQALVRSCVTDATAHQRQVSRGEEDDTLNNLRQRMQVGELPAAEVARFRERVAPVAERFTRDLDQGVVGAFNAALEQARASAA